MDSDVAMGIVVVLSVLSGAVITRLLRKL